MNLHDLTTDDSLIGDLARHMSTCALCKFSEPLTDHVSLECRTGLDLLATIRREISTTLMTPQVRSERSRHEARAETHA